MNHQFDHHRKGFTIIELMVSLTVLTILTLTAGKIYLNYTSTARDLKAANLVYEESRFLMERMVREVRQNTIDYEAYFNRSNAGAYGADYCQYDLAFYSEGPDGDINAISDNVSTGERHAINAPNAAITNATQDELYLINVFGDERSYMKRIERTVGSETVGKVNILRMVGEDFGTDGIDSSDSYNGLSTHDSDCSADERESDGLIDTWHCEADYPCDKEVDIDDGGIPSCDGYGHTADDDNGFIDISPSSINVVDLKFIISPEDDPWKAYSVDNIQIQPHVTIQFTAEANPILIGLSNRNRIPSITLTSTISTRIYDEIKSPCARP